MSPVRVDYVPGRIDVRFSHDTFDYIHLDVHLTGDTTVITPCNGQGNDVGEPEHRRGVNTRFTVYMSSLFCAFGDFIAFLEAIAVGVERCSFRWDAEGPEGGMSWLRSAHGMGTLGILWHSRGEDLDHGILVDRRQAVQALYGAFRSFVESTEYDPFRYEALSLRHAIDLTLQDGTAEDAVSMLVDLHAVEVEDLLQRLLSRLNSRDDKWRLQDWPGAEAEGTSGQLYLVSGEWDGWTVAQRLTHLDEILGVGVGSWSGANLRDLRSAIIEAMLAHGAADAAGIASESGGSSGVLH
jgi:hypothetical protein